ncbi:MAG: capsule assembly Wzi family protein [Cytophagales bacterium]|nr:capsule assembly Wzi family protein [Cytophagales bacterium]
MGSNGVLSQSTYLPVNSDYYHLIDRYEIKHGKFSDGFHTAAKPYPRKGIAAFADSLFILVGDEYAHPLQISKTDQFNLKFLQNDSWEWTEKANNDSKKPIFNFFYKKKSDLFHFHNKDFDVHVNPVLYFQIGDLINEIDFINTRGIELRGMINNKIGFYTFMADNQARFPDYVRSRIDTFKAVPGEGFWKGFKKTGVDFLTARGYITFNIIKNIGVQFGHDKNFIGNGYRSLILSDYSSSYLFLKLITNVWKINYQNIFAEMVYDFRRFKTSNTIVPKKYFALHHLSVNITKNINIGLFESIVFGREDSLYYGQFDFNYLNPVIFYRSVEQQLGSPDNAFMGIDFKWNFLKHFSFYGQVVLDEFLLKEIRPGRDSTGWWGNKHAFQMGLKYIDVAGISNLDLQLETNIARPYIYAHFNNFTNYTHYNQPLAHPLGANFREVIAIVRYQPIGKLQIVGKLISATYGTDSSGSNWGGNVLLNYATHEQEYNNKIAQGIKTNLLFADLTISYQVRHNLFIDLKQIYRKLDSDLDRRDNETFFISLAIRLNIAQRLHEF